MKIKSGDMVRVMAGREKGKQGKVGQVFPDLNKVVVEGLNQRIKHVKPKGTQPGQRVTYSGPMDASNVQLISKDGLAGRVGYTMKGDKKVRVLKTKKGTEEIA